LFVRFGSLVVELTVAVLDVSVPDPVNVAAFTLIVMITNPPTLTDPRVQVTVVVPVQLPCEAGIETELKVTVLGSTSVTVTPCATAGPLFVTWSV